MKKNLLVLGAGGHGKVVAEAAQTMKCFDIIAFLDDACNGHTIAGYKVIGKWEDAFALRGEFPHAIVAVGNSFVRLAWHARLLQEGFTVASIIHAGAIVSPSAVTEAGCALMAGSVVNACSRIETGSILNTGSTVDHDCVLHEGVHISPGAHLGGNVTVGARSWICMGASIINNICVGKDCILAAGGTLTSNMPDNTLYAGVPASYKKKVSL